MHLDFWIRNHVDCFNIILLSKLADGDEGEGAPPYRRGSLQKSTRGREHRNKAVTDISSRVLQEVYCSS